ncbi:hypothetical protein ACI6QG_12675 [Roseococcus sp. DSY-14]|uniref:hypothetical protein n=1 Tax=Roseococcus sp. DSY-14 TaxID=3369650 RepID=UPI00387B4882
MARPAPPRPAPARTDNSTATRPRSPLRGDTYAAFEALPEAVRRALHESLVDWCPLRARAWLEELVGPEGLRPAQAARFLVEAIRGMDEAEVRAFAGRWAGGAAAYPHLAAGATLQRYAGAAGMPAARPVALPPRPKPPSKAPSKGSSKAPSKTQPKPHPKPRPKARPARAPLRGKRALRRRR